MGGSSTYIYFDGSCGENRNVTSETPAGWGFCVVSGDNGIGRGHGEVVNEKSGAVVTNPLDEGYIGPVLVKQSAELSGLLTHLSGFSRILIRAK